MTYTHLTPNELVIIEEYFHQGRKVAYVAKKVTYCRQTIYKLFVFFETGQTVLDYYNQYRVNKKKCGWRPIVLPATQAAYVKKMVAKGWTPDVIVGRGELPVACSVRTLYRLFQRGEFDVTTLPLNGKRKLNGYKEKRGKQAFRRRLSEREKNHPQFKTEFGHLEGDTIVGIHHKSTVVTLVERLSKVIITLKPEGRKAKDIEKVTSEWLTAIPRHLFKSITFDCGKEFSNWQRLSNQHDIDVYFADPGMPSQRALNEHSNGLLRKDGLPKQMDFNSVDQAFVSAVASKRNHIPRKLLNYRTPLEVFMSYMNEDKLSNLI